MDSGNRPMGNDGNTHYHFDAIVNEHGYHVSNDDLVRMLFAYTADEVSARRIGQLRKAVQYRKIARLIGRHILTRVERGTWYMANRNN